MFSTLLALSVAFARIEVQLPEFGMDTPQIITYYGYDVEEHIVVTEDGYMLKMFRIPRGKGEKEEADEDKPVVMLHHGLLDSSFTWVNNPPEQSLGYILADKGYDVWLGNNRGNHYSRSNTQFSTDSDKFWDFSWDEMAKYDLPAEVNYVLEKTGKSKISYVGHSQGSTQMFANLADTTELHKKINYFGALGPVAYASHMKALVLNVLNAMGTTVVLALLGQKEFLTDDMLDKLGSMACSIAPTLCNSGIEMIAGISYQTNMTRMGLYTNQFPSGTSVKNMNKWSQAQKADKFQKYDYGIFANPTHYGSLFAPQYNLDNVDKAGVPISLYSGSNDLLADPTDVSELESKIPNALKKSKDFYNYSHMDLVWGVNAWKIVYPYILSDLKDINGI